MHIRKYILLTGLNKDCIINVNNITDEPLQTFNKPINTITYFLLFIS